METIIFFEVEPKCINQRYRIRESAETCCRFSGNICRDGNLRCGKYSENLNEGKTIENKNRKDWWTV